MSRTSSGSVPEAVDTMMHHPHVDHGLDNKAPATPEKEPARGNGLGLFMWAHQTMFMTLAGMAAVADAATRPVRGFLKAVLKRD
ncbi:hypothetical protein CHLRE_10g459850v5 [Chlamydomonas reinhardtii]|uniref:Uncharacterized protein n=1 Tax=Chlamydomonas reinhardtii TaxID=3055 RepID=A0A2K3DBS3_CHLRE|nr:uncharacterized protein CHLRE_10g459850v5 [Chlamydomonas reinhardtii]PNW77988.1 hypothetical protein CHLRE_10g459850v5 [Chlamydomonas reinhardtii]